MYKRMNVQHSEKTCPCIFKPYCLFLVAMFQSDRVVIVHRMVHIGLKKMWTELNDDFADDQGMSMVLDLKNE